MGLYTSSFSIVNRIYTVSAKTRAVTAFNTEKTSTRKTKYLNFGTL